MTAFTSIEACVFDAYGTLFDVHSAVGKYRPRLGEKADAVSMTWRTKQLEYTWLRSLMGAYTQFWAVTGDALDYSLEMHGITDDELRADLMQAYLTLEAYPEVISTLEQLKANGYRCAILTNGSPDMIEAAVESAGLQGLLEHNLSVDSVGIFKPDPRVYQLAVDTMGIKAGNISFQSSNAWDAVAAAHFGFRVAWINRFAQKRERMPAQPDAELADLSGLPALLTEGNQA
ncbi:MAG: haloacid dehalogenase type II [Gammaproteobacteria bacterium]|nr:haloacid dehalogenase type II [Gammaproteobacteria bacterium]